MNRKSVPVQRFVVATLLLQITACWLPGPPEAPANVLLITVDTLRPDYLGSYGNVDVATPNIDGLAVRGIRFSQAVAQVPTTTPSHASILTGTYPWIHGLRDLAGFRLNIEVPTLTTLLKAAGYETAAFVSAAVLHRRYGLNSGFDVYDDRLRPNQLGDRMPGTVPEIDAGTVTDRAIEWLERPILPESSQRPFFLWVHYYDPHVLYNPPEPFRSRYETDLYAGEVAYADSQIGRLFRTFTRLDLMKKTLIVLASDHGEAFGEHGETQHGIFLYDVTMRIPLIVSGPGLPSGLVIDQQVRTIDIMPTIAEYLDLSPGIQAQGTSLLPGVRDGSKAKSDVAYMETLSPKSWMGWSELRAVRTDKWKFILAPRAELYDLEADPSESKNVLQNHPTVVDHLAQLMKQANSLEQVTRRIETQRFSEQTLRDLRALGYTGVGPPPELIIGEGGPDPKDRLHVLQVLNDVAPALEHYQFEEAIPLLEGLVEEDPSNPMLFQMLGFCFQKTQELQKARQTYQRAIDNGADTPGTYTELGELLVLLEHWDQAVATLRQAEQSGPLNLRDLRNLATALLKLGQLEVAAESARQISERFKWDPVGQELLNEIQAQRKKREITN